MMGMEKTINLKQDLMAKLTKVCLIMWSSILDRKKESLDCEKKVSGILIKIILNCEKRYFGLWVKGILDCEKTHFELCKKVFWIARKRIFDRAKKYFDHEKKFLDCAKKYFGSCEKVFESCKKVFEIMRKSILCEGPNLTLQTDHLSALGASWHLPPSCNPSSFVFFNTLQYPAIPLQYPCNTPAMPLQCPAIPCNALQYPAAPIPPKNYISDGCNTAVLLVDGPDGLEWIRHLRGWGEL